MEEVERNIKLISSWKEFDKAVEIMKNSEIEMVIAGLFLDLERRGADKDEVIKSIQHSVIKVWEETM